ncbi:hypothetical protein CF319_g4169 [Tilletia indica]|nr:hypothetical protein CF319_g4169 [Tilletia indica]
MTLPRSTRLDETTFREASTSASAGTGSTRGSDTLTPTSSSSSAAGDSRNVSPSDSAATKVKRRGRKALTEQLKRRSKRLSAQLLGTGNNVSWQHLPVPPRTTSASAGLGLGLSYSLEDEWRRNMGRASDAEDSESESDESDEDDGDDDEHYSSGLATGRSSVTGDESDVGDQSDSQIQDGDRTGDESVSSSSRRTSIATRKHRAYTSPVHKLAAASASTLDFGSQLGSTEGSRRTSAVSTRPTASPSGTSISSKRTIPPTSPLLLPSTPSSPRMTTSTVLAAGVFSSGSCGKGAARRTDGQSTSAAVLEEEEEDERESSSLVGDEAGSQAHAGTASAATPRMPLTVLGAISETELGASPHQGRTTPFHPSSSSTSRSRPTSSLRSGSGLGNGAEDEEEDAFFDANESGASMSPIQAGRNRALDASPVFLRTGRLRGSTNGDVRRRSEFPSEWVESQARESGYMLGSQSVEGTGSSDLLGTNLSFYGDSTLSSNSGGEDTSYDASFGSSGSNADRPLERERSMMSISGSSASSPPASPTRKDWEIRRMGRGGSDTGSTGDFRPLLGGRAGDPLSTATLRQDASVQAKVEGMPPSSDGPLLLSSSELRESLQRLAVGAADSSSAAPSSPIRPVRLIRTRTGSILPAAKVHPQAPPPLAPLQTRRSTQSVAPILIESPATPETSGPSIFTRPMAISTDQPSPDLQMVEPHGFNLRPIDPADQDTIRGRPRGASMGAVSGRYTPARPSILAVHRSALTPPDQSPGAQLREMELLLDEAEASRSSGTHRRSESSGTGVDGSSSSHHRGDDAGSRLSHGRDQAMSGGVSVSDRTTNTSNSHSVTDVSSSDTSISAHEADLEMSDVPVAEMPNFARTSRNGKEKSLSFHPSANSGSASSSSGDGLTPDSTGGSASSLVSKNRARARSLGVPSHTNSLTPTPGQMPGGAASAGPPTPSSVTTRSRSGSTASLQRQAQLPLRSPASFVLAVVGHRGAGKSTVIKKGLKQYGLSKPNSLSEKVTSYSTKCLVDNSERTIEVLEIDAAVLLNGPTKRFSWPKFLPSIDAVILCYDASEVSSFRSMSELLENFSVHGVRTVMLACKSEVQPKALNPLYASEMAAMYNVGLAECTSHTEEGKKRMRNCFSYLVKGVAKARAGKGNRSNTTRQVSQMATSEADAAGVDGSSAGPLAPQLGLAMNAAEIGRMRGNSVPNGRSSGPMRVGTGLIIDTWRDASPRIGHANTGDDPWSAVGYPTRKLSNATNESEPMSMSNSDDEESSDQRHRSMMLNAQLGLQSAKSAGGYVSVDELYDKFFFSAVSNKDPAFATTFMIFYRGFAKPIDLLMQAITRFEVLTDQEKSDEEVIRFSLIRMVTFLREWVQDYPGDLSGPETYPTLMNFFYRLLEHRHCADVVRAAEPSFMAVAGAPDLDAAWSVRLDSHKPSSVAADYPPLNLGPSSGSTPPLHPASSISGSSDKSFSVDSAMMPSVDVSVSSDGRPRADSGSVIASPASLAESYSSGAMGSEKGRLTAHSVLGRDRSSSTATSISFDRQPSSTSSDSNTLSHFATSSASSLSSKMLMSQDPGAAKARIRAASDALLDIDDSRIAQELTVMAWSIFMNIKPRDLLRHALVPPEQRPDGPCMQEIRHFNYISAWIVNMILAQSKLKNRSRLLERFMNVAVRIRNENDYATLYCIIGALESQAIYRLGSTWNAMSDKPVLKQYHSLTKLMSHTKSYSSYRLALQNSEGRTIPHLGVIYQDLVSISAGNPSKTPVEGAVHWRKFQLMDYDVSNFIACQQCSEFAGHSDPALQQLIMGLPVTVVEDESLMDRSKLLEPNGTRRTDEAWTSALTRKSRRLFASASSSGAT